MSDLDPVSPHEIPEDWPFPPNSFVRASRLLEDGATDEQVREAIQAVEDGGSQ